MSAVYSKPFGNPNVVRIGEASLLPDQVIESPPEVRPPGLEDRGLPPPKRTRGLCCPRSEGELLFVLGRTHVAEG